MAQEEKKDDSTSERKGVYKFGGRNVRFITPSQGYPTEDEAKKTPNASLALSFVHGYNGSDKKARQNLYITPDGKYLIYYMASVCVVYDHANNTQRFFTGHNDDVTCICIDGREGSTLVASGQKDPKDRPGQGKDMPKIIIWDYSTMKEVERIEDVCWGSVNKLQWSKNSDMLYMLGGDPDQTLKGWNSKDFDKLLIEMTTMKADIFGFKVNSDTAALETSFEEKVDSAMVDEMVFYGVQKYSYLALYPTKKLEKNCPLTGKMASVSVSKINKNVQEKAFVCCEFIPTQGLYAVGATSGTIYLNRGSKCLSILNGHTKCVGDLYYHLQSKKLISSAFDQCIKKFTIKKPKNAQKPPLLKEASSTQISNDINGSKVDFKPKAMAFDEKTNQIFIGNKSNQIIKYNPNGDDAKEPCTSLILDGHDGQAWGLCVHPKEPYYATAGYDGKIKIWDAIEKRSICTHQFDTKTEFTCGTWASHGACLVFGTEDSRIAIFRWFNDKTELVFENWIKIPPKRRNAAIEPVSNLSFNNGSSLLAVSHMDSNVYIYSIGRDNKSGNYTFKKWKDVCGHNAAPTHIQWSKSNELLRSFTRDYEICYWKLNVTTKKIEFVPNIVDPDSEEFIGKPLIAGWDVQGLYQSGFDGTDLNDATITKDGTLIASGDDYGIVRLHNYPAINPSACLEYNGHAEFVVTVAFLCDDSRLISCGGADQAVFQWNLKK